MLSKKLVTNILRGNKCVFCGKYSLYRLSDKRIKCKSCRTVYSLNKLKINLEVLYFFYVELSARKAAKELGISYNSVSGRYMQFREEIAKYSDF